MGRRANLLLAEHRPNDNRVEKKDRKSFTPFLRQEHVLFKTIDQCYFSCFRAIINRGVGGSLKTSLLILSKNSRLLGRV